MSIKTIRTNFSQVSDKLLVNVGSGGASITLEIGQWELMEFARSLLDVADDCLRKLQDRTEEDEQVMYMVRDALDAASAILR